LLTSAQQSVNKGFKPAQQQSQQKENKVVGHVMGREEDITGRAISSSTSQKHRSMEQPIRGHDVQKSS
jgi:hypothetical protein